MGKNRDRLSIIAAILEAANSGATKTRIMITANLSFNILEKYLDVAKKAGLLELHGHHYQLTARGREYITNYRQFFKHYNEAEKSLENLEDEREKLASMCHECIKSSQYHGK